MDKDKTKELISYTITPDGRVTRNGKDIDDTDKDLLISLLFEFLNNNKKGE